MGAMGNIQLESRIYYPEHFGNKNNSLKKTVSDETNQKIYERISQVYAHCATAFAITIASAVTCAKIGFTATLLSMASIEMTALFLLAVGISLVYATLNTKKESSDLKKCLFGMFAICQGVVLSPLVLINGTAFLVASGATVALTGGLGVMAMSLKESFEKYETILTVALVAIGLASLGALILPMGAAAIAHEVSYVGGFALFSCLFILDTHKVRSDAENPNFDPINHAMGIYLDAANLLVRIFECYLRSKKE